MEQECSDDTNNYQPKDYYKQCNKLDDTVLSADYSYMIIVLPVFVEKGIFHQSQLVNKINKGVVTN